MGGVPATEMSVRLPARLHTARWVAMNNYILNNKKTWLNLLIFTFNSGICCI